MKKEREPDSPSIRARLLWWFGMYLAFQLPLVAYAGFFLWFPTGLIGPFVELYAPYRGDNNYFPWMNHPLVVPLGYLFYLAHFLATLFWPGPKSFRILMVILAIALALNLTGCLMCVNFRLHQ